MSDHDHKKQALPPGWSQGYSNSQKRTYYVHGKTQHTQWHFPTASEAADPLKAKQRAQDNMRLEKERLARTTRKRPQQDMDQNDDDERLGSVLPSSSSSSHVAASVATSSTTSSSRPKKRIANTNFSALESTLALADLSSVAIIVPFRDIHSKQQRAAHLAKFVPHMKTFLNKQLKGKHKRIRDFHIYIVEQSNDGRKFNRGKLLNIGFDLARKHGKKKGTQGHDVFIFHDVDLLPEDDLAPWYAKFPTKPIHIARVWNRYSNNPKYFGGIVSFNSSDMRSINGYPNTFWGWGGEDDEMQKRLERLRKSFDYPNRGTIVDLEQMDLTEKLNFLRQNREWKCLQKWEALDEHEATWRTNGLADLSYIVLKSERLDKDDDDDDDGDTTTRATKITVDIKLNGDHWSNKSCNIDFKG